MPHDEDGDDEEVFVVVHDGKAYDYSTDNDVVVTVRENGIKVVADEGTIKSANLSGPYVIHDLNGKLGIRSMTEEDEKFLKSKFDAGILPRNENSIVKEGKEDKDSDESVEGSFVERMIMRRKEHKKKMELLRLEHDYWKMLYEHEFGTLGEQDEVVMDEQEEKARAEDGSSHKSSKVPVEATQSRAKKGSWLHLRR